MSGFSGEWYMRLQHEATQKAIAEAVTLSFPAEQHSFIHKVLQTIGSLRQHDCRPSQEIRG